MDGKIELIWDGEVVGYINDVRADNFHAYGRWEPSKSTRVSDFVRAVQTAMEKWDDDGAGVDVFLGPDGMNVVEVTSFEDGEIEILSNPGRWKDRKP